jgi:hypothetical protein
VIGPRLFSARRYHVGVRLAIKRSILKECFAQTSVSFSSRCTITLDRIRIPVNSAPSEARKRGSGGGSPRKYDDLLTGPSDLSSSIYIPQFMSIQCPFTRDPFVRCNTSHGRMCSPKIMSSMTPRVSGTRTQPHRRVYITRHVGGLYI